MPCVIGVGSPSGDDQAGWRVIDTLHALGVEALGVKLVKLDRPGAMLLTRLEAEDHVIVVDASVSGARAGAIRRIERADWPRLSAELSSHGFGLAEALTLAERLDMLPARLEVYGIELGHAAPGLPVSEAVEAGADALARQLAQNLCGKAVPSEENPLAAGANSMHP